jgi:hypothetical protein
MIQVPIKAIAEPGEDGNPIAPEQGDVVDIGGVTAKVARVKGEDAILDVQSINGEPVRYTSEKELAEGDLPNPGTEKMRQHLRGQFRRMEEPD